MYVCTHLFLYQIIGLPRIKDRKYLMYSPYITHSHSDAGSSVRMSLSHIVVENFVKTIRNGKSMLSICFEVLKQGL